MGSPLPCRAYCNRHCSGGIYRLFGEKSVTQRIEYQQAIDSLKTALNQEQDTLEYYRDLNRRLSTDPQLMEQVVREQYNMKRAHEDIYVVE